MTVNPAHAVAFCQFMIGKQLGEGMSRIVYENRFDPTTVIKYQARPAASPSHANQNVLEWEAWGWAQDHRPDIMKWLARCYHISECGRFMIQQKVRVMREHERPKKMPAFLTDFQTENFGFLRDGRLVACDYGTIMGRVFRDKAPKGLRKVFWTA